MSTSIDVSTNEIEVIPSASVIVETDQNDVCVQPYTDIEVTGSTKEYAIIGDAIFASQNIGEAPQWLTSIIDTVIGTALDSSLTTLAETQRNLITAIEELGIANNNYNEIININTTVDEAVTTRLAALNANVEHANATIAELQITKASATEASAVALDVISSSLNDTAVGTIGGTVGQLNSSISTLAGTVNSTRTLVESRYGELNQGMADLQISVDAAVEGVTTVFAYDSVIKVGNNYYKSGFGLKAEATSGGSGSQVDPYKSEFWIDATRFKFTNSNATGGVSPFTIDATGSSPKISFNGTVSFSNITGDDVPEAGATRNVYRGNWANAVSYVVGDVVTYNGSSWVSRSEHVSSTTTRPPSSMWGLNASKGDQGVKGESGVDARAVSIVVSDQTIEYDPSGENPSPATVTFTATAVNTSGTAYYEFVVNGVPKQNTTSNTYSYTVPSTYAAMPSKVEVWLREGTNTSTVLARDLITLLGLKEGADSISIVLSNEAHVVPATVDGTVTSFSGSGTTIEVWQGTTQLSYGTTGKGTFSISSAGTSVTVGTPSIVGKSYVYGDISAFTANTGKIVFTINVRGLDGKFRAFTKVQTFAKSLQGTTGADGAAGPRGQSTVTIYRNVTAKPGTPAVGGIPAGWYTYVPTSWTGNVWRSEGTAAAGSSSFVWGEPYLDFTSWRAPSKTTINGAYIETGTITAAQILANTITGDKIAANTITAAEIDADSVFANSLLVNNGVISGSIQSTNYGAGTSGWRIDRDGAAVFNECTVRGLFSGRLRAGSLKVLSELNNSEGPIIAEFFKESGYVPVGGTTYTLGEFILPYSSTSNQRNKITSLSGEITINFFGFVAGSNWSLQYALDSGPWVTIHTVNYQHERDGITFQALSVVRLSEITGINTKQLIKFRLLRGATGTTSTPYYLSSAGAIAQCSNL